MESRAPAPPNVELIRQRLGGPEYGKLFQALRRRLEEAWPDPVRSFVLTTLTDAERAALADLHGWRKIPTGPIRISLAKLDESLRASSLGVGAVEVVEALGGPIVPRRPTRLAARERKEKLWALAESHPAIAGRPQLRSWVSALREHGLLARVASGLDDQLRLLNHAVEVIASLPADHKLLCVLAVDATGDPHALDPGAPLTAIVLRAVALLAGRNEVPPTALERRRLWLEVGVLCDPLSTDVLVLGLRPSGDRLARHLCESADDGEPRRITLRELTRSSLMVAAGTDVFLCENPGVVNAAADQLGPSCSPLVCVEGIPSTAAVELIARLRRDGAQLRFHGDFDWWGLRIGNALAAYGALPWRFGSGHYLTAVGKQSDPTRLQGDAVTASWDPALRLEMCRAGRVVYEEQVLPDLLQDLRSAWTAK